MSTQPFIIFLDRIASVLTITLGSALLQSGIMAEALVPSTEVSQGADGLELVESANLPQNQNQVKSF